MNIIKFRTSTNASLPHKLLDFFKKQVLQIINPFPKVYRETKIRLTFFLLYHRIKAITEQFSNKYLHRYIQLFYRLITKLAFLYDSYATSWFIILCMYNFFSLSQRFSRWLLVLYFDKKDINDYFVHRFLVYHRTEGTRNLSSNWFSLMGEFPEV